MVLLCEKAWNATCDPVEKRLAVSKLIESFRVERATPSTSVFTNKKKLTNPDIEFITLNLLFEYFNLSPIANK